MASKTLADAARMSAAGSRSRKARRCGGRSPVSPIRGRPHLHFHVADAEFALAEGLPHLLKPFTRLGGYDPIDAFDQGGS
jgi:hypothetical protein